MISFRYSTSNESATLRSTIQRAKKASDKRRRSQSRSPISDCRVTQASEEEYANETFNKTSEQKRLEQEVLQRKLRIAKWRIERQLELSHDDDMEFSTTESVENINSGSLEDYDNGSNVKEVVKSSSMENDEEDSLEKYMEGITQEINNYHRHDKTFNEATPMDYESKVLVANEKETIVRIIHKTNVSVSNQSTIFSSKTQHITERGALMEQDPDGLEYSSEDETTQLNDNTNNKFSLNSKKSKADIILASHNQVIYQPFRKDFYTAVSEINQMTSVDVVNYRKELDNIKVVGKNCPNPIKTWPQCIISSKILKRLKKDNYEKPTPIQAQALPIILSGRNMIGIAKTGSGKTLAFLLPMFRHIQDQPPIKYQDGPIAIIMTPTRELALQTTKECRKFGKLYNIRCVAVYGGIGVAEQISELKRGTEIVVCTPGRMIDMLAMNKSKITNLRRVTYVVIDEADRMFDMGFEPQIRTILNSIRPDRQLVMFSATFPKQMEALARQHLYKPIEITVGGRSIVCQDIIQNVLLLDDEDQKYAKLLELLGLFQMHGSVLVFVDSQIRCDELIKKLMNHSYPCMSLHGGIDQYDRDSTITYFKNGDIPLMVATSVAARGLDVKNLILVVNYDCPNHYEEYVHRCGRTGRAGKIGYAYTFITSTQEKNAGPIIKALELSGASVPENLNTLWNNYIKQMEAQGKKVQDIRGDFGGRHGYSFDSSENQCKNIQKKMQGILIGLENPDDVDGEIDQHIQLLYNSKKSVHMENNELLTQNHTLPQLETAKKIAAELSSVKNENLSSSQTVTLSLAAARQRAQEINMRLNYKKPADKVELTENLSTTFQEELEINHFPTPVRSKIISKAILDHIRDYADVDIYVRGQYYPNNKNIQLGDKKLHLQIRSSNEYDLQLAKAEITRLIKEEMIKMQNLSLQLATRGRYKVI